jgi:[protein-PII] uridylyltransferase
MPVPDPAAARERLKRHLMKQPVDKEDVADFLRFMPATYVFSTPPERAAEHWQMLQLVPSEGVAIRWADQRHLGFTDFTICSSDKPGLFSQILAVFYAHDLRLHSVRASTSTGTSPVAVDVVSASYGDRLVPPSVAAKVAEDLSKVIRGEVGSDTLLAATGKDPDRRQEIFNWTWQQGNPGILEVRAPRGRGMAYRLSKLIARQGWDIEGARVAQWAGQGAASFSITGPDRRELTVQDLEEVLPRSSPAGRGAGL